MAITMHIIKGNDKAIG